MKAEYVVVAEQSEITSDGNIVFIIMLQCIIPYMYTVTAIAYTHIHNSTFPLLYIMLFYINVEIEN